MPRYGTWGRVILGPPDLKWPLVQMVDPDVEVWSLQQVSGIASPSWEQVHEATDLGSDHKLVVRRSSEGLYFEWRGIKAIVSGRDMKLNGTAVEPFVDRVVFPTIETLDANVLSLHGAAVAGDQAVILLGKSGVGKSTTVTHLNNRGWELRADDVVSVKNLLLRPSASSARLRGANRETEDFLGSGKTRVITDPKFNSIPIGAILVLQRGEVLSLREIPGVLPLLPFMLDLEPGVPAIRGRHFQALAALARAVPIYEMTLPESRNGAPSNQQIQLIESLLR